MQMRIMRSFLGIAGLLLLAGCSGLGQTPPPPPHDIDSLATAIVLTENAPPPGFETATLETVDAGLGELQGYRYMLELRFDGVYVENLQPAVGRIRAEVWWDGLAPARRVILDAEGDIFTPEAQHFEAVRIVDDYYLVDESGRCLLNVDETARAVANLDVGSLLGGVLDLPYGGAQAVLNGVQAYRYGIDESSASLPMIHREPSSRASLNGELWITPDGNVAVRYYANVEVAGVQLLDGDRLVSGDLFIRYDVYDIGTVPNISIPYGC